MYQALVLVKHPKSGSDLIVLKWLQHVLQSGISGPPWTGMSGYTACSLPISTHALKQPCSAWTSLLLGRACSSEPPSLQVSLTFSSVDNFIKGLS